MFLIQNCMGWTLMGSPDWLGLNKNERLVSHAPPVRIPVFNSDWPIRKRPKKTPHNESMPRS